MEQNHTQTPGFAERMRGAAGWFSMVCHVLETSVIVFTRRRFGRRFFGLQAAGVIPLVLLYSLCWRGHNTTPLMIFLGLYLVALGIARAGILRRSRQGDTTHSRYSGTPSVMEWPMFRGRLSERAAKQCVEPLVIAMTSLFWVRLSEPLGWYLVLGACGSAMSVAMARSYERNRLADMRDQYIEQRHYAERFRDGGGQ